MHPLRSRLRDNCQFPCTVPAGGASAVGPSADSALSDLVPEVLMYVEPPAMSAAALPNGETITYALVESSSPALNSPSNTITLCVQTGAGGAGAPAACGAARPTYGNKYFGLKITCSAGANAPGVVVPLRTALTQTP